MLSLVVCDDNPIHLRQLEQIITSHTAAMDRQILAYNSPEALFSDIQVGRISPDICILDIQMQCLSGIELAKKVHHLLSHCAIIFVSSFLSLATEVYETPHVYFILKDELEQRIDSALELALSRQESPQFLCYSTVHSFQNIPCDQILYLERVLRKTRIVRIDREDFTSQLPSELFSSDLQRQFIRCHQSYWVNFSHIRTMERNCFFLSNQDQIPISRTYRDKARSQFFSCVKNTSSDF